MTLLQQIEEEEKAIAGRNVELNTELEELRVYHKRYSKLFLIFIIILGTLIGLNAFILLNL